MKKANYLTALLCFVLAYHAKAQLTVSGEIRPRAELYNGTNYTNKTADNVPGIAIQQRSRFTLTYMGSEETAGLKIVFSPQLINFWGEMPQTWDLLGAGAPPKPDVNLSVFEAYAQYKISDVTTIKFGRQAISYGDQRWFGALQWAAAARAHEAIVAKFKIGGSTLDAGLAHSNTRHRNVAMVDNGRAGYKGLQYLWFEPGFEGSFKMPMLFNSYYNQKDPDEDGLPNGNTWVVTVGAMPTLKVSDAFKLDASAYYQSSGESHTASLFAISGTYKAGSTPVTIGADIVSGKAYDDADSLKTKTWKQPFGTNHKFYGFMDFFYVGEADRKSVV